MFLVSICRLGILESTVELHVPSLSQRLPARKSSSFGEMMERKLANEQFLQHKNRGAYRIWYLFVIAAFV
jgi:hypothetical protein